MKIKNLVLMLLSVIVINVCLYQQAQTNQPTSESSLPLKQAKGRLKAIARDYMANNQKITDPFELHQNWRFIKKDIYKKLYKEAYCDQQKQILINEDAMPSMTDKVFKKLVELKSNRPSQKRKKYAPLPDAITIKESAIIVRKLLRNHGIIQNDRSLVFKEIMLEIKSHLNNNLISSHLTKEIATKMILKFKTHKLDVSTPESKSYLQEFFEGWRHRFKDQVEKQDWNVIQ